eukprot:gene21313-28244_t
MGVFCDGVVPVGSVVAMVPGVVYARTQYQHMKNYPSESPLLESP